MVGINECIRTKSADDYWNESQSVNKAELEPNQETTTGMSPNPVNIAQVLLYFITV